MSLKRIIIITIAILLVALLGIKGKSLLESRKDQVANEPLPDVETISVRVIKPKIAEIENREPFLAQLQAKKSIKLSTKLAGYIQKVHVKEAQNVKKGDTLVEIDQVELQSSIEELKRVIKRQKSDEALTRSMHNSNIKLYEIGGLAKEKLDQSKLLLQTKESIVQNSQQKLLSLKHQLSYLKIVAPFDGEIETIFLHEGDLVVASKPILALSSGEKKLLFSYAPTKYKEISKDQEVYSDDKKIGSIRAVYNSSKNGLSVAEVKLTKEIDLPLGSSLNIEVLTKTDKGCTVPNDTILHKKDGTFVMVYRDGEFEPLKIETKIKDDKSTIILPCPSSMVAKESEVKLAKLPAYKDVNIIKIKDE